MPYTKTTWTDNTTPLSASNMNNLETQYEQAMADGGIPYAVDSSTTANTITVSISPAPSAYSDGLALCVKVANTTTGATTMNVNGLGAVSVKNGDGSAVGAGDLNAGVPTTFRYVGGASPAFIASGSGGLSGTGNASAADVLEPYTFTSASGKKQTGTMPNQGSPTLNPGQNITPGYYSGGIVANPPHGSQDYTSAGTYTFTVPSNVTKIWVECTGGGGGGAGSYFGAGGGGGAGGTAYAELSVSPENQYTVTVGAGDPNVTASNVGVGYSTGGTSSFSGNGTTLTADGGESGANNVSGVNPGGPGGVASGGNFNITGAKGGNGGGSGSGTYAGGQGGDSFFATGPTASTTSSTQASAGVYGAGGAGGSIIGGGGGYPGSAGGAGRVRITW